MPQQSLAQFAYVTSEQFLSIEVGCSPELQKSTSRRTGTRTQRAWPSLANIVNLIASTKTESGLKVYAVLDDHVYALKKVADAEFKTLRIEPHVFHGEWNYTIHPQKQ